MVTQFQPLPMFGLDLQALQVLQALAQAVAQALTLALLHTQMDLLLLLFLTESLEPLEHQAEYL